jgi:hypothetical protein
MLRNCTEQFKAQPYHKYIRAIVRKICYDRLLLTSHIADDELIMLHCNVSCTLVFDWFLVNVEIYVNTDIVLLMKMAIENK